MQNEQYEQIQSYCGKIIEDWKARLGLSLFEIDIHWYDRKFSQELDGHGADSIAFVDIQWQYLQGFISISSENMAKSFDGAEPKPDKIGWVRDIIIHELCHFLVAEMREYDVNRHAETVKHEERTVTSLARAFAHISDTSFEDGRKIWAELAIAAKPAAAETVLDPAMPKRKAKVASKRKR